MAARSKKTCPNCKRGVNARWNYCPMCGAKLKDKEGK